MAVEATAVVVDIISTKKRKTYGVMRVGIKRSMREVRKYSYIPYISILFYYLMGYHSCSVPTIEDGGERKKRRKKREIER